MRAVLVMLATVACGGATDEPPVLPGTEPPPCELAGEGWRIVAIELPMGELESSEWSFDLDGDGHKDDALGGVASLLASVAAVESSAATVLRDPTFTWGLSVQRCADVRTDHLRVELLAGTYDEESDTFLVELGGIPSVGASDEAFLGRAFMPVSIFGDVQTDPDVTEWAEAIAVAAVLEAEEGAILTGRLGMGFRSPAIQGAVGRAVARTCNQGLADDPGCPEACATGLGQAATVFDADGDGAVTPDEVLASDLYGAQFNPDIDLFDGDVFWPGHDGEDDSLSLAFRFTAERVDLWPPQ